jgi:hypothetical protein
MSDLWVSHEKIYQYIARVKKTGETLASQLRING